MIQHLERQDAVHRTTLFYSKENSTTSSRGIDAAGSVMGLDLMNEAHGVEAAIPEGDNSQQASLCGARQGSKEIV